ncbi:MAG: VTT domain-containing protein [Patescibacteria group bacterium]|nr:VTT domain-containing protein [Patescibacteria group bacterium]
MIESITTFLENLAHQIPLPLFAFIGSIIDEIIAIFPSPFVPIIVGTLAYSQGKTLTFLFLVALTGTIGKTLATLITYWVADKVEDWLSSSKIGAILGVDNHEIEKYGNYLNGTNRDEIIMIVLRALPFIPTLPVSIIAGMVKLNIKSFIFTTFVGTYIRFMFYLILAYEGVKKYQGLLETLDMTTMIMEIAIVTIVMGWLFLLLRKKWDGIMGLFFKVKKSASNSKKKSK